MPTSQKKKPLKTTQPSNQNDFREEVSLTCACSRDLTIAEIGRVFRARTKKQLENFLPHLNDSFKTYGIDTCLKKSHFLAQVGHESAQTRLLEESGISDEMEKEKYGGYKGRGLLQLTFQDAYEKYGAYVGADFLEAKRTQLATPKYGTDSAGWFWKKYKGVDLSDYSQKNDFIYITQKINGAFNGWDDRLLLLGRAIASLLVDHCPTMIVCPNVTTFSLTQSASNSSTVASFAFGYWFDPTEKASRIVGVTRSKDNAIEGYSRFVELTKNATDRAKSKKGNFGFDTQQAMIEHATIKIKQLRKPES